MHQAALDSTVREHAFDVCPEESRFTCFRHFALLAVIVPLPVHNILTPPSDVLD